MSTENEFPKDETDFEEYKIVETQLDRESGEKGTWICILEYGFTVDVPRGGPIQPRTGQMVRAYGDIDNEPRGVFVEGKKVYLRTVDEQAKREADAFDVEYAEALKHFDGVKDELYKRHSVLPDALKNFIAEIREDEEKAMGGGKKFDVIGLEHAMELCDHAVGLELLLLDDLAGLKTFFDRETSPTQLKRCSRMADSWFSMTARMKDIGRLAPTPRTSWALGFLHHRRFNLYLDHDDIVTVNDLTKMLVEARTEGRKREIQAWLETSAQAEQENAKRRANDPATRAEFEKRAEEIEADRQGQAEATLKVLSNPNPGGSILSSS